MINASSLSPPKEGSEKKFSNWFIALGHLARRTIFDKSSSCQIRGKFLLYFCHWNWKKKLTTPNVKMILCYEQPPSRQQNAVIIYYSFRKSRDERGSDKKKLLRGINAFPIFIASERINHLLCVRRAKIPPHQHHNNKQEFNLKKNFFLLSDTKLRHVIARIESAGAGEGRSLHHKQLYHI